jgi:archaellum component FlaC
MMELMESRWTDDRMDDLKHQVDELGRRMEEGFTDQRREMNARFDRLEKSLDRRFDKIDMRFEKVDERFEKVDERFEKVDAKFDAVHEQIARSQETVVGLYAMLSRYSLWFAGTVAITVFAALLSLWLR